MRPTPVRCCCTKYSDRTVPKKEFTVFADGYNILHAWTPYHDLLDNDLDSARMRLIEDLTEYHSMTKNKVVLVFDAHKVKSRAQEVEQYKGIQIVYTKPLETADTFIEKTLAAQPTGYRVMVVSNDSMIQKIILGRGGIRVTVAEFMTQLEDGRNFNRRKSTRHKTQEKVKNLVSFEDLLKRFEDK